MQDTNLFKEPHNPKGIEIFSKTMIGLIIWVLISFLIFIILILVWGMFEAAIQNRMTNNASTTNPLLPLILIVIAFFATLIGNIIITGFYNLFFSNKYYDISKMFKLTLLNNIILFFVFAPLYIIFYDKIQILFIILAFHIIFSVFLSLSNIEFTTNPNYVSVHMIWTSIWLLLSILIFAFFYKTNELSDQGIIKTFLTLPAILAYTLTPLLHSIWEKIYYKFYQMNNNFLYIPSLDEVIVDEDEENWDDNINVEN